MHAMQCIQCIRQLQVYVVKIRHFKSGGIVAVSNQAGKIMEGGIIKQVYKIRHKSTQ